MKRICFVVAHPATAGFLGYEMSLLSASCEIWVVANFGSLRAPPLPGQVHPYRIRIERRPHPLRDLAALWRLYRLFRRERFDSVHSMTPKAGLLAMLAASSARVPVRIHTFMGEVWATRQGLGRILLKSADRVTASLATELLVVSPSERAFLRSEGVISKGAGRVLANGSVSGVDTARFAPNTRVRDRVRLELGIDHEFVVFLFLGRVNRDKGLLELADAWVRISAAFPATQLLIVGPDEEGLLREPIFEDLVRVIFVEETTVPEDYINAADVLCLPSKREGFGTVVIEAACAGVPCVGSRIYGLSDAVIDGTTGLLFEPTDPAALEASMTKLVTDPSLRHQLGRAARQRVISEYSHEAVATAFLGFYEATLGGV